MTSHVFALALKWKRKCSTRSESVAMNQSGALLDIDAFADVPVPLEVRLGCRPITLDAIAKLEPGAVVPLDRAAGETFDVFIGDLLLATAEVVIVEGVLAIRITDLYLTDAMESAANSL